MSTREIRFGQAVLLGCRFTWHWRGGVGGKMWFCSLPPTCMDNDLNGPWETRDEAVESVLKRLGVITDADLRAPNES